jgi:hypothetical protein
MAARHTFVLKDRPTIAVSVKGAAEYNKKAAAWAQKVGLPVPDALVDGTPTLSNESTSAMTNTVNSDDVVDNMTDQVVDDSQD